MDQDNQTESEPQEGNKAGVGEGQKTSAPNTIAPAASSSPGQSPAPSRPRRPQRSARVEGSIDISEPRPETKTESTPAVKQAESSPDGTAASHPIASLSAVKSRGERSGPKGPVRAVSVPQPPASRAALHHLNPHAQRALSVVGTADTQAQTVEDFRCVCVCVSQRVFHYKCR